MPSGFNSRFQGTAGYSPGELVETLHSNEARTRAGNSDPATSRSDPRLEQRLTLPVNGRRAAPTRDYFPLPTAILICFGLASSRFGSFTVSTPFLYSALIASSFTVFGSVKVRLKVP